MKNHSNEPFGTTDSGVYKTVNIISKAEADRKRQFKVFLIKVLCCVLIALLFLVAAFAPSFATVLSCTGVVIACSVAAVLVDRRFWR